MSKSTERNEPLAQLEAVFGTAEPDDIIARFRELERKAGANPPGDGQIPAELARKILQFTEQVETLNGTVTSMEDQLSSLYNDKERLEREIGAADVDEVIQAFRRLETIIMSMEHQLMNLYAGKELLETELGKSDPHAVVAAFRSLNQLVLQLQSERTSGNVTLALAA